MLLWYSQSKDSNILLATSIRKAEKERSSYMYLGQVVGKGRARTRRLENKNTKRNSKDKMYMVCPEEGQTCYQKFSISTMHAQKRASF